MILDRSDHVALRIAETAVLRTTTYQHLHASGKPRRAVALGLKRSFEIDPARLDILAQAGLLKDLAGDADASPERGRRRLIATERGRLEWRFASAEDPTLCMTMDDLFHRDGDLVDVEIRDRRYVDVGAPPPEGGPWTTTRSPGDEESDLPAMDVHGRIVVVPAFVNGLGERLIAWNCRPTEPAHRARFDRHSTAAAYTMTGSALACLDAAARHRLYYAGGHTHFETACGTTGASMSSDARNLLLRFGMLRALPADKTARREDYVATDRGRRLLKIALPHAGGMTGQSAKCWEEYLRAAAKARAAA